ncbi:WSC domain-containing protein ARB_07870-like [Pecten maximus]|uniref:WSC domain-containing protein ARB_07870-like n=1 Tax=Pecten maximus TaxID=6579 RepID=UPI001458B38F|nr:WSC domain-containing protein ARB_07870-like [Pecten maximus]
MEQKIPWLLLILWICTLRPIESASQGCYQDLPHARFLASNPGNYEPDTITPTECGNKCGEIGCAYSGLTGGKVCLCGDLMPPTAAHSSMCTEPCAGDAGLCVDQKQHKTIPMCIQHLKN